MNQSLTLRKATFIGRVFSFNRSVGKNGNRFPLVFPIGKLLHIVVDTNSLMEIT